jgi:hypothetical protein
MLCTTTSCMGFSDGNPVIPFGSRIRNRGAGARGEQREARARSRRHPPIRIIPDPPWKCSTGTEEIMGGPARAQYSNIAVLCMTALHCTRGVYDTSTSFARLEHLRATLRHVSKMGQALRGCASWPKVRHLPQGSSHDEQRGRNMHLPWDPSCILAIS